MLNRCFTYSLLSHGLVDSLTVCLGKKGPTSGYVNSNRGTLPHGACSVNVELPALLGCC